MDLYKKNSGSKCGWTGMGAQRVLESHSSHAAQRKQGKQLYRQARAEGTQFVARAQVDTHVHHSACMHQKHLLHFIKSKLRKEPDEVVIFRDGKYLTLKEVVESPGRARAGGHARAPQRVHAPEAPAALHQEQAAQGAGRGGHLPRRQVPHAQGGVRVAQPDRVRRAPPFRMM